MSDPRIGLIGCGRWGSNYLKFGLAGVYDHPTMEGLGEFIDSMDALVIATPTAAHTPVALECLSRFKPILIEKPIALCFEDAELIAAMAEQDGTVTMVGHLMLFHPAYLTLANRLDDDPHWIRAVRTGGTLRTEGPLLALGVHDMAMTMDLLELHPNGAIEGTRTDDMFFSGWADTTPISISSTFDGTRERRYLCMSPEGLYCIDRDELTLDGEFVDEDHPGARIFEPLRAQYNAFVEAVMTGENPVSDADFAAACLKGLGY